MLNIKKRPEENLLKNAFESGFTNAVLSLSSMARDKIYFNNFHFGCHSLTGDRLFDLPSFHRSETNLLITTEIFGDISGRSYMLLSRRDVELLVRGIYGDNETTDNIKEEYLKELDNILSASVITKLSNELQLRMYGDVPVLAGNVTGNFDDIIFDDFTEQTNEVYINAVFFSFDSHPDVTPFFVWVIDSEILNTVKIKSVA